jgi:cyclophilin family peptidyl-prolyl cis-trans isomerase
MRFRPLAFVLGFAFAAALPGLAARDYVKEVQVNQFRPHGGDKQEIADFFAALVKGPASPDKVVAPDAAAASAYVRDLGRFADLKLVGTSVEKLYTVAGTAPYQNYRAIARFKFRGRLGGKLIERTDCLGLARLGKAPADWRLWGVVWQDSGIDVSDASLAQLDKPRPGEEICVMTTEAGAIKLRLFPDKAPKAVRNFKALAAKGFYDNRPFLRVYPDFMIQGGALDGTPEYDISSYGKLFEDEFARDLFNFRGALCMGNVGPDTNGNQFYIVQSPKVVQEHLDLSALPLNAKAKYQEIGGRPYLDMRYTVFGQVFEGIEAVDAIAKQKADDDGKPLENPIRILKVEFRSY